MIKVLSYNTFFRAMSKGTNKISQCEPIIATGGIKRTTCLDNVVNFIEANKPYDFVGLQEATNWRTMQALSPTLTSMNTVDHKPGQEDMVLFYNKNYNLDDSDSIIKGYMQDTGRPFVVCFFKQKIAVINVHAGHYGDIFKFDFYLTDTINSSTYKASARTFMAKLQTYDIIMMGDFNNQLPKSFSVMGRKLYGTNKTKTCCNKKLEAHMLTASFDHILSTNPNIVSDVFSVSKASDHMPIIATLKQFKPNSKSETITIQKNIGYDFDGVFHKNVTPADSFGQRNPTNYYGPFTNPFNRIIDQIWT